MLRPPELPYRWKLRAILAICLVCVLAITVTVFILRENSRDASASDTAAQVKAKISRHILLPSDEEPALATITDKSKLTTPVLKQAENGDKILLYQKNQLAIVYRPSIDRVVNMGAIQIDTPKTGTEPQ